MTIHLDNGTTIDITNNRINIINGFRGFYWDLDANELAKATGMVNLERPNDYLIGLISKLLSSMQYQLDDISDHLKHCPDFRGLLNEDDLEISIYNLHERVHLDTIGDKD